MAYNKLKTLVSRYNTLKGKYKGRPISYYEIDATSKWVQYSLDEVELKKLLLTADFSERFDILNALKKVESKIEYMYKHKNFDMKKAVDSFKRAKLLLKL
jgi:hypothetical protein